MITLLSLSRNPQDFINHLNRGCFCLLFGVLIFFSINFGIFKEKKDLDFNCNKVTSLTYQKGKDHLYGSLKEDLFFSLESTNLFQLIDLEKEVVFLGINARPDASDFKSEVYLFFDKATEMIKLTKGQKLFLSFNREGGLELKKDETPFWIELEAIQKECISVQLGVSLKKESNDLFFQETQKATLKAKGKPMPTSSPDFKALTEAFSSFKWWGPDRLFQVYGGETFGALKGLERIEYTVDGQSLNIHVKEGDYFYWKEGAFLKQHPEDSETLLPSCFLRSIHFDKMEWTIWDETGLRKEIVTLKKERPKIVGLQLEKILTRMRMRTTSSISCQLNQQTLLLKKGDWLFKTSAGWKVLKSLKEIEEVINFQVEGDLFVFDGIEKVSNIPFFLGTLFDKGRTTMQAVKFSLPEQKNRVDSLHTKNTNFSKLQSTSQEKENLDISSAIETEEKIKIRE